MPPRRRSKFEFDAVLSFAGEDRAHAEAIARAIQKKRLRVFYDRDNQAELWGRNSAEFERIYGPAARFFLPLISRHYKRKDWPQFELKIAKRERAKRKEEFFLPIQIEDVAILGLHDDLISLSVDIHSPEQIADALAKKCREFEKLAKARAGRKSKPKRSSLELALLSEEIRQALALIAATPIPLTLDAYKQLLPSIKWDTAFKALKRSRLIDEIGRRVMAVDDVSDALRKETDRWEELNEKWIAVLEPKRSYVDLRVSLALHYVSLRRFAEAAELLVDYVQPANLGYWNSLYKSALGAFLDKRSAKVVNRATRLSVLNAVGICAVRMGNSDEAVTHFQTLLRESRRAKSSHWVGQAYLNLGIAAANLEKAKSAEQWYRKAETHGRKKRDWILVGRALGNLSQLQMGHDLHAAKATLEQSLKIKRAKRDGYGIAIGKGQLARLLYLTGDPKAAVVKYGQAIKSMDAIGLHSERVQARIQRASIQAELGQKKIARAGFREAAKIADHFITDELRMRALGLDAQVSGELGDWRGVKNASAALLALATEMNDATNAVCARHGLGIAEKMMGNQAKGARHFEAGLKGATTLADRHWMERCAVDATRKVSKGRLSEPDTGLLRRRASVWQRQKKFGAAGDIWSRIGHVQIETIRDPKSAIVSFRAAVASFVKAKDIENAVVSLAKIAECNERLHEFNASLKSLDDAHKLAVKYHEPELAAVALNQRAVLLQELGRFDEACDIHRAAVAVQRKARDYVQLEKSLHNYGEALRKAEKYPAALKQLAEAEALARSRFDYEAAIGAAHCTALVLEQQGDDRKASQGFQRCRNEARQRRIWCEYARAWEAMANLAWTQRNRKAAIQRYQKAFTLAKKHGCKDAELRIALNLGNAFYWVKQLRRARDVLAPYEHEASLSADSYNFHARLADIYEECGQPEEAVAQWVKGEAAAAAVGNSEYIAYCSAGLGTHFQDAGAFGKAEACFERARGHEHDSEDRVILLRQLLDVLLEQRKEKRASAIFNEANAIALREGFRDQRIELHMRIFDYDWPGKLADKKLALKLWVVALLESHVHGDADVTAHVAGHGVAKLTTPGLAPTLSQFNALRTDLLDWVGREFPRSKWPKDFVALQLSIVEELLPHVGKPRTLARAAKAAFLRAARRGGK